MSSPQIPVGLSRKVLISGPTGSGKSSLVRGLGDDSGPWNGDYSPTLKSNLMIAETSIGSLQIWDLASVSSLGRSFFTGTSGLLLLVDASKDIDARVLDAEYDRIKAMVGFADDLFPCFVLASKCDLVTSARMGEVAEQLRNWALRKRPDTMNSTPIDIFSVSALEKKVICHHSRSQCDDQHLGLRDLLECVALRAVNSKSSVVPSPVSTKALMSVSISANGGSGSGGGGGGGGSAASTVSAASESIISLTTTAADTSCSSSAYAPISKSKSLSSRISRPIKVAVCGGSAVGKTSIIQSFVAGSGCVSAPSSSSSSSSLSLSVRSTSLSPSSSSSLLSAEPTYVPTKSADLRVATLLVDAAPADPAVLSAAATAAAAASAVASANASANASATASSPPLTGSPLAAVHVPVPVPVSSHNFAPVVVPMPQTLVSASASASASALQPQRMPEGSNLTAPSAPPAAPTPTPTPTTTTTTTPVSVPVSVPAPARTPQQRSSSYNPGRDRYRSPAPPQVPVQLQIWDTSGRPEAMLGRGRSLLRGADCLLLVYDTSSAESFAALEVFYSSFRSMRVAAAAAAAASKASAGNESAMNSTSASTSSGSGSSSGGV